MTGCPEGKCLLTGCQFTAQPFLDGYGRCVHDEWHNSKIRGYINVGIVGATFSEGHIH